MSRHLMPARSTGIVAFGYKGPERGPTDTLTDRDRANTHARHLESVIAEDNHPVAGGFV